MMITTQPSQFVKTAVPVVQNVSDRSTTHNKQFLRQYDGASRTSGIDRYGIYNNDYVIYDGFDDEASERTAKYTTSGKLGLVQRYMTMHSFSLSAAGNLSDYVMSSHQIYSVNRIRDVEYNTFYTYPNFKFTKITDDGKYHGLGFEASMRNWINNRTGTPRPLTCSVRLFISWCAWGARKMRPQQGQDTAAPDGFVTQGGIGGGTYEGTYTKMADTFTDDAGNNFGPVYQINNYGYITNGVPTILFNLAINKWQVGMFDSYGDGGVVWYNFAPYVQETNHHKVQSAQIMPAYQWTFSKIKTLDGKYYRPSRSHGRGYACTGPVNVGDGLGLAYLHSLYVYV